MRTEYLVRRAQRGSKDAFVALIEAHKLAMYRTAKTLLTKEEDVEDALSEAVLRAFSGLPDLREPGYFKAWLMRLVINCAVDLLRSQRGEAPLRALSEAPSAPRQAEERRDLALDVQSVLEELSGNDRLVLVLYYFVGLPSKEIAELLHMNDGAVRMRLTRSRQRFEKLYAEREGESS